MKTIYDEAIENLRSVMAKFIIPSVEDSSDYGCLYDLCHFYNTLDDEENKWLRSVYKALERAKKVEELLEYQSNYINSIIDSLNVVIDKSKSSQDMIANELEELK